MVLYRHWLDEAKGAKDTYELSKTLKDYYQEAMPELSGTFADMLQAALDSVNWYEIAESMINDIEEDED